MAQGVRLTLEMTLSPFKFPKKPELTLRILTGGSNFVKIMGIWH
jgi:hypothetical protein